MAIASVVISVAIACSSGSSSDNGGASEANSEYLRDYISLLELIPDTEDSRFAFTMSNYAMAADLIGLDVPGPGASDEELFAFLSGVSRSEENHTLAASGPFVSGWGDSATFFVETRDARGFDSRNVRAAAALSQADGMEFAVGDFPASDFASNANCDTCGNPLELTHSGKSWLSWGDDDVDVPRRLTPPVFDRLGRGVNWWVTDDSAVRTITSTEMRQVISTAGNDRSSLADIDQYKSVVEAMTALNTYSMFLTTNLFLRTPDNYLTFEEQVSITQEAYDAFAEGEYRDIPSLRAYGLLAIGAGLDERGHYTTVAMLHLDELAARNNENLFKQVIGEVESNQKEEAWSEIFPEVETRVFNNVLTAKLRGTEALPIWLDLVNFYSQDSLFAIDDTETFE